MKKPAIPHNEEERLKALRSLNVLDTLPEERFDRLTRLAKRMFNVPMALVSLVDEDRQWFKSCVGIDVSETSRDISFCGHAILGEEVFVIPDTLQDERFADNPTVINAPSFRFYAGCPLRYADGTMLGALCIMDTRPRTLDDEDLAALKDLAELTEHELMAVQLATQDELTKLSNRRGFIKLAQNCLDICISHNISSSLVFLDLNKFKAINDVFGHAEGDKALNTFSEILQKTVRKGDVIGRLGGDEFAVFLTDAPQGTAEQIIATLRASLAKYKQDFNSGYDISFCEGIVEIDYQKDFNLETLLNKADSLMYDKKAQ